MKNRFAGAKNRGRIFLPHGSKAMKQGIIVLTVVSDAMEKGRSFLPYGSKAMEQRIFVLL